MHEKFVYFADHVRSDEPLYFDGDHGLVDMNTMEAIYKLVATNRWVSLD